MRKFSSLLFTAPIALLLLAACGGSTQVPATGVAPMDLRAMDTISAQPGDRVTLRVWGEPTFTGDLVVDPDGTIVLPKAGVLRVTAIPGIALRDSVRARLERFLQQPTVDVVIQRRVVVYGAVQRSGVYFVDAGSTVRDAIADAGGIAETGSQSKVSIIREGTPIEVADWKHTQDALTLLRSGDQVLVGRRSWLDLNILSVASLSLVVASFILTVRK
jgi:protein involved in polysaccharide export with SLBB domain